TSGIAAEAVEAQEQAGLIHAFQDTASITSVTMLSAKAQRMLKLRVLDQALSKEESGIKACQSCKAADIHFPCTLSQEATGRPQNEEDVVSRKGDDVPKSGSEGNPGR
ncbi:unnamed protein product, partial [Rangifer tarandus platyrhynchus]